MCSLWPIDRTLSGTFTPCPGIKGDISHCPDLQAWASPSDGLMIYPAHSMGWSYSSAVMQSLYSTAPADLARFLQLFKKVVDILLLLGYRVISWRQKIQNSWKSLFPAHGRTISPNTFLFSCKNYETNSVKSIHICLTVNKLRIDKTDSLLIADNSSFIKYPVYIRIKRPSFFYNGSQKTNPHCFFSCSVLPPSPFRWLIKCSDIGNYFLIAVLNLGC